MRAPTSSGTVFTKPTGQSPKLKPRSPFGFRRTVGRQTALLR
jgi:hypothetical protein